MLSVNDKHAEIDCFELLTTFMPLGLRLKGESYKLLQWGFNFLNSSEHHCCFWRRQSSFFSESHKVGNVDIKYLHIG